MVRVLKHTHSWDFIFKVARLKKHLGVVNFCQKLVRVYFICVFHKILLFLLQEALALISEYSEAGITVRGTYVPPGKTPPEGERKLYLAIESSQELAVAKAKSEITRLIKEELLKLQTSAHHMINKARYKVL